MSYLNQNSTVDMVGLFFVQRKIDFGLLIFGLVNSELLIKLEERQMLSIRIDNWEKKVADVPPPLPPKTD